MNTIVDEVRISSYASGMAHTTEYTRGTSGQIVDIIAFMVFGVSLAVLLYRAIDGLINLGLTTGILIPLVSVPLSLLAADLLSGIVHYLADNYGDENTPLVGKRFCKPFREHHTNPKGITERGFIEANANTCIITLPLVILVTLLGPYEGLWSTFLAVFVAFVSVAVIMTNEFHKWAHLENPPAVAKILQRWGIILTPDNHDVHHVAPYDTYYCVTTGWLNALFDRLGILKVEVPGDHRDAEILHAATAREARELILKKMKEQSQTQGSEPL